MTDGTVQERLEAALRRLPATKPRRGGIPYQQAISGIARQLVVMARADRRPPNRAAGARELARAVTVLRKLERLSGTVDAARHLQREKTNAEHFRLDPTARALPQLAHVGPSDDALALLPLPLRVRLLEVGAQAGTLAAEIAAMRPPRGHEARGQPKKNAARAIAVFLYQEIERLTGKKPGRSVVDPQEGGAFLFLVQEVFEILKLKGKPSPARAARAAIAADPGRRQRSPSRRRGYDDQAQQQENHQRARRHRGRERMTDITE